MPLKAYPTCFSGECTFCSNCSGGIGNYTPPDYKEGPPQKTNWEKYEAMLKAIKK